MPTALWNVYSQLELSLQYSACKKSWNYLPKYGLKPLAEYHQIDFTHHRAGADAEVCAKISLLAFEKLFLTSNDEVNEYMKAKIKKALVILQTIEPGFFVKPVLSDRTSVINYSTLQTTG